MKASVLPLVVISAALARRRRVKGVTRLVDFGVTHLITRCTADSASPRGKRQKFSHSERDALLDSLESRR
jgi:hypothetical protein